MKANHIYCSMSRKTYQSYLLPSEFTELEKYIIKHKLKLMEHVVDSIEYAVSKKLDFIEIFKFINSEFTITLSMDKFKENIFNIYEYYINNELYELCARVKTLDNKLNIYEQKKQKEITNI